jgi:hypothetical protein
MPRSFFANRASRRPWRNRAGGPIRSALRWWRNWSRASCAPHGADRHVQLDALSALVLAVFDRYPVPASLGEQAWSEARAELARRLQLIGLHAPKRAFDICEPSCGLGADSLPIGDGAAHASPASRKRVSSPARSRHKAPALLRSGCHPTKESITKNPTT